MQHRDREIAALIGMLKDLEDKHAQREQDQDRLSSSTQAGPDTFNAGKSLNQPNDPELEGVLPPPSGCLL